MSIFILYSPWNERSEYSSQQKSNVVINIMVGHYWVHLFIIYLGMARYDYHLPCEDGIEKTFEGAYKKLQSMGFKNLPTRAILGYFLNQDGYYNLNAYSKITRVVRKNGYRVF